MQNKRIHLYSYKNYLNIKYFQDQVKFYRKKKNVTVTILKKKVILINKNVNVKKFYILTKKFHLSFHSICCNFIAI